MSGNTSTAARILAAQARHCDQMAAALSAARAAGGSTVELEDLEAQELAARRRYQELAVDMPARGSGRSGAQLTHARRPWWRFW